MTALSDTAYYARRTINWSILTVVGYILLRILWGIISIVWLILFPPQAPPPNHAFGTLPKIQFPSVATVSSQLAYKLETIEGGVPTASNAAAVYFMPKSAPKLLALNETQETAKQLSFDFTPIAESKNVYRFTDSTEPLRRLRFDIVSKNFILRYSYEQDSSLFTTKNLPNVEAAKLEAIELLESYNIYQNDYKKGPILVTYLRLNGNRLVTTSSQSQADAVRIDFFRKPIGSTKIVTPYPSEGSISIILSGNTMFKKRILQFAYTYWPIDYQTIATYPLKSSETAWAELQQGKGYIAYAPNTSTITIRSVYLAYYDSLDPQTYIQPVFVFEGDNNFIAYIPAISSEWIEN